MDKLDRKILGLYQHDTRRYHVTGTMDFVIILTVPLHGGLRILCAALLQIPANDALAAPLAKLSVVVEPCNHWHRRVTSRH
jgi:hypothetical protein